MSCASGMSWAEYTQFLVERKAEHEMTSSYSHSGRTEVDQTRSAYSVQSSKLSPGLETFCRAASRPRQQPVAHVGGRTFSTTPQNTDIGRKSTIGNDPTVVSSWRTPSYTSGRPARSQIPPCPISHQKICSPNRSYSSDTRSTTRTFTPSSDSGRGSSLETLGTAKLIKSDSYYGSRSSPIESRYIRMPMHFNQPASCYNANRLSLIDTRKTPLFNKRATCRSRRPLTPLPNTTSEPSASCNTGRRSLKPLPNTSQLSPSSNGTRRSLSPLHNTTSELSPSCNGNGRSLSPLHNTTSELSPSCNGSGRSLSPLHNTTSELSPSCNGSGRSLWPLFNTTSQLSPSSNGTRRSLTPLLKTSELPATCNRSGRSLSPLVNTTSQLSASCDGNRRSLIETPNHVSQLSTSESYKAYPPCAKSTARSSAADFSLFTVPFLAKLMVDDQHAQESESEVSEASVSVMENLALTEVREKENMLRELEEMQKYRRKFILDALPDAPEDVLVKSVQSCLEAADEERKQSSLSTELVAASRKWSAECHDLITDDEVQEDEYFHLVVRHNAAA